LRGFNAEQVAVGGVALWVSHDGSLGKSFYRAKAEPKPKAGSGEPQPLYSNSLVADLSRIKTRIVQEAVSVDPALALDVLLDSLAGQLLHGAHSYQMAIDVQPGATVSMLLSGRFSRRSALARFGPLTTLFTPATPVRASRMPALPRWFTQPAPASRRRCRPGGRP
jgi:hypothetical protein